MSGSISGGSNASSGNAIGSGPDEIILYMAGDSFGPSNIQGSHGQFTLNVDGQQIGGLQTVYAQNSSGGRDTFVFRGDFSQGEHRVAVTFANNDGTQGDKTDIGRDGDRNIYVKGLVYNGTTVSNGTTPIYESPLFPPEGSSPGNAVFTVYDNSPATGNGGGITSPGPVNVGSGPDRLTMRMSEDPYQGDAQFTLRVDGQQVGGVHTTTANSWMGQQQVFNFYGDWGSGAHTITVSYISDRIGALGPSGTALDNQDQNLYVNGIDYNGVTGSNTPLQLPTNGSWNFYVPAGGQSGTPDDSNFAAAGASTSSGNQSNNNSGAASTTNTGSSARTSGATDNGNATVSSASLSSGTGDSGGMSFLSTGGSSSGTTASNAGGSSSNQAGTGGWSASTSDWKAPSAPSRWSGWNDNGSWSRNGGWSGNWSNDQASQWKQSAWVDRYH
ncbi:MAG: carbohydrate-binding domain-containing protein [Acetobacteraceae bacterium]